MVGGNGVDNILMLVVFLGQISTNDGVRAFHLVVHGLADVVQKAGPFGGFNVQAQFRGHDPAQGRHFQGVLEHVLREAGAVFELPDEPDDIGMNAVHARVKGGLLAHFAQLHVHFLLHFFDHVFNAGRVDAAVGHQTLQGHFGDLAAQWAVSGDDYGFRRVVNDQIDAGGRFQGANVAAFAADDAALHAFRGQGHGGDGLFGHIIAGVALYGGGQNFFGLAVGGFAGLGLNYAGHAGGFVADFGFQLGEQQGARFFHGKAGDGLQTLQLFLDFALQLFFLMGEHAFLAGHFPFQKQDFMFLFRGFFHPLVQALQLLFQLFVFVFQFLFVFFEFLFAFPFLAVQFVLALEDDFLFLGLGFFAGFVLDAFGQVFGVIQALVADDGV